MRIAFPLVAFLLLMLQAWAQSSIPEVLERFNDGSVPYISPEKVNNMDGFVLLDAREKSEYEVSRIKNGIWVGHENFDLQKTTSLLPNKEIPIVVYCSVGVRSEQIGEKLQKAGYKNVKNLFGGIFLWKNQGHPVYDRSGKETEKVHAYSKFWGKLLTKGEKVYSTKNEVLESHPK